MNQSALVCRLNFEVGEVFAQAALRIAEEAGLHPGDIDLISSHGQTIWHDVQPDGSVHSDTQLGEGAVIAERTGITTINDLRNRDIAVGGQGAPLAGYVDWLLLRDPVKGRAVQNLGGIGNVTFLPPLSDTTTSRSPSIPVPAMRSWTMCCGWPPRDADLRCGRRAGARGNDRCRMARSASDDPTTSANHPRRRGASFSAPP